ncbi:hypothetical protein QVD17_26915 [Tagetes erecta]|uniref:Uncharacterized protein n=1 Tax=Tagetes erecta TaxID=13708 RepID=A0AAD8NR88_TARER|nr:hypothetical protein QVD17_26915 [Tagetes erecta]
MSTILEVLLKYYVKSRVLSHLIHGLDSRIFQESQNFNDDSAQVIPARHVNLRCPFVVHSHQMTFLLALEFPLVVPAKTRSNLTALIQMIATSNKLIKEIDNFIGVGNEDNYLSMCMAMTSVNHHVMAEIVTHSSLIINPLRFNPSSSSSSSSINPVISSPLQIIGRPGLQQHDGIADHRRNLYSLGIRQVTAILIYPVN